MGERAIEFKRHESPVVCSTIFSGSRGVAVVAIVQSASVNASKAIVNGAIAALPKDESGIAGAAIKRREDKFIVVRELVHSVEALPRSAAFAPRFHPNGDAAHDDNREDQRNEEHREGSEARAIDEGCAQCASYDRDDRAADERDEEGDNDCNQDCSSRQSKV